MKKTMTLVAIALLVCVVSVFALVACNLDNLVIEGEGSWDIDADTQEDCVELLEGVFAEALKNPNFKVEAKLDGAAFFTESVLGANSCTAYDDENKTYAVKDGNDYVVISESLSTYWVGKENYDENYCHFLSTYIVGVVKELEGGTFACHKHIAEKDSTANGETTILESEGTLSFTWTSGNDSYEINTVEKNDIVQSVTITGTENGTTSTITMTFTYGNAVVTVPADYKSWETDDDEDAGEEEEGDEVDE